MAVTFGNFCAAIRQSLSAKLRAAREDHARFEAKRRQIEAEEAAWRIELQKRAVIEADADGAIAVARRERQEQQEQERLNFLAGVMVRQQAKLSR